ncbi:lysine transporter LysE (plasmid) [Salipiger sp. CCB-MM3]|uniref:LysE family translocator n=1 Tax=Salipiger sp. CCB-MM3 TaxID=1792508 RepID=UPI00080A9EEC|nr:LysE family translocator [Salipiger sp. CCB-MM3]ANT63122.1 lysine transporter LysE [Salipiger sp. CCB-MM3]
MPEMTVLLTYLAVLIGFVLFPGPSILLTLARASTSGTRAGIATSLGIGFGDVIHTLLAVIGVSAVIMASANAFLAVKVLGAGYLIYIGLRSIFDKTPLQSQMELPLITPAKAFRQACLAEVLNPKSAMFFLAFLPQFVVPSQGYIASQLLVLGLLFVLVGTIATLLVALGAGILTRTLRRSSAVLHWQGKVVGTLYCALGIRLFFQQR